MSDIANSSEAKILVDFEDQGFDDKEFIEKAINSGTISLYLSDLAASINIIDKKIYKQVSDNDRELLSQVSKLDNLEENINSLKTQADSMQSSFKMFHQQANELYGQLNSNNLALSRMHNFNKVLRRMLAIVKNIVQLDKILSSPINMDNLYTASIILSEIDSLSCDKMLENIKAVDCFNLHVANKRNFVVEKTFALIDDAIKNQDVNSILFGMKILISKDFQQIVPFVEDAFEKFSNTIRLILNKRGKKMRGKIENDFIVKIGLVFDEGLNVLKKIDLLERCLILYFENIASDKIAHLEEIGSSSIFSLKKQFVSILSHDISEFLAFIFKEDPLLKDSLEVEYPSVHHCLQHFFCSTQNVLESNEIPAFGCSRKVFYSFFLCKNKIKEIFHLSELESSLLGCFKSVEKTFLLRSSNKINKFVSRLFSDGRRATLLKSDDVSSVIELFKESIDACKEKSFGVERLLNIVSQSVISSNVKYIELNIKKMINYDFDDFTLTSSNRLQNASLVNIAYLLYSRVNDMICDLRLPPESTSIIKKSNMSLFEVAENAIDRIINFVVVKVRKTISSMDSFNYNMVRDHSVVGRSTCVKNLENLMDNIVPTLLLFQCEDIFKKRLELVVETIFNCFVWQVSVCARPIGRTGLCKMVEDFSRVEKILDDLGQRFGFEDLGELREVKLIKGCLGQIMDGKEIGVLGNFGVQIPRFLCFIMTFGPQEMKTPFSVSELTAREYLEFVGDNSKREYVYGLIRKCLHGYVRGVQMQNLREFHFVYPLIIKLLPSGN